MSGGSKDWLVVDSGPGEPAFNMALDEALLEFAPQTGAPVLRFYGWTQPAATFGYFQKIAEVEAATALRPLVRRTTGGGLVPHDHDWTYSVAVPPNNPWYELRASESYERMHRWIQSALALRGVVTELAPCCRKEVPGQCFAGYEKSDVLFWGRKIAGAAQRRTNNGLLIQGSIQPPPSIARESWREAMQVSAARDWGTACRAWLPGGELSDRANQFATEKYSRDDYNRRR